MSREDYDELSGLIEAVDRQDEEACRTYLRYAKEILMKEIPVDYVYVDTEINAMTGKCDYVISAKIQEAGEDYVQANIWELKAPQCSIFNRDTGARLRPSVDLISAENQLLNYYYDNKDNAAFREFFDVIHPDKIRLGGIIIGCERTKVTGHFRGEDVEERKRRLYRRAINVRNLLWRNAGIKIITWDQILERINPVQETDEMVTSPTPVQLTSGVVLGSTFKTDENGRARK